jgi:hypothetical protein
MKAKVALRLSSLDCLSEAEQGSQPYIWPMMIVEEGGAPRMYVPDDEWADFLLAGSIKSRESAAIPQGMSKNFVHFFDERGAALVVLVVVLFEKEGAETDAIWVLRYLQSTALTFVSDHIAEFRQRSGERRELRDLYSSAIDVRRVQRLTQGTVAAYAHERLDQLMGISFWAFSGAGLKSEDITFNLSSPIERFTVAGRMDVMPILPSRCDGQREAVTHCEMVIKGLQGQRASLQSQLHHATPQQRAGLIAAIARIAQVDMPAAEAALAEAQTALDSCLLNENRVDTPPGNPISG